jgi:hypothetical protein
MPTWENRLRRAVKEMTPDFLPSYKTFDTSNIEFGGGACWTATGQFVIASIKKTCPEASRTGIWFFGSI